MPQFTPTQGRYLSFIHAYIEAFGMAPAMSEIAEALKVQSPSVNGMLKTLDKKKLIEREPGVTRSIEILVDPELIPTWKKKIHRTVQFYAPADASKQWLDQRTKEIVEHQAAHHNRERAKKKNNQSKTAYQFKISLLDFKPTIWRQIETGDVTLEKLHELIQLAMGWTNSHMHQFKIAGQDYRHPRFMESDFDAPDVKSYQGIRVSDLVEQHGTKLKFVYDYDFGDGWSHEVFLQNVIGDPKQVHVHPRCVAGENACPPEDVGGVWGYADFLEAINDPKHKNHEHFREWYHGGFDPTEFDAAQATLMMS